MSCGIQYRSNKPTDGKHRYCSAAIVEKKLEAETSEKNGCNQQHKERRINVVFHKKIIKGLRLLFSIFGLLGLCAGYLIGRFLRKRFDQNIAICMPV